MVPLDASKLFQDLSESEMARLREVTREQTVPQETQIFQEGDSGTGLYVVRNGQICISALVAEEERRVLSRIGPGDFFGEMALLDNEPRSATATAELDSELFFVPRAELMSMLENSPRMAVSLMRQFSLRMRDFNRKYIQEVLQAERLTLVGRFARSIVHDFKNPLNVIGLSAELVGAESVSQESRMGARNRIRKQVERLNNMISELLEFTRGEQTGMILSEANYRAFLQPILAELEPELKAKGIKLECAGAPPEVNVLLDPKRILHVVHNLVHNAVDAIGSGGGTVQLKFELTPKFLITEVRDTGPGIAPEIESKLFEAFATYGKSKGTGLGLSICSRIIEDHKGEISARNHPEGGAVFTYKLPLPLPAQN